MWLTCIERVFVNSFYTLSCFILVVNLCTVREKEIGRGENREGKRKTPQRENKIEERQRAGKIQREGDRKRERKRERERDREREIEREGERERERARVKATERHLCQIDTRVSNTHTLPTLT